MLLNDLLRKLYITGNYVGASYLRAAVELTLNDEDYLLRVLNLYREIAFRANRKPATIERDIRTVALRAWQLNYELLCEIAGYKLTKPPTNAEFIEMLVYFVKKHGETPRATG